MADPLGAFLEQVRVRIDHALERYLPRPPACPPLLSEAMRYSLFAGGKRLRPVLTLAAADAVSRANGPDQRGQQSAGVTPHHGDDFALPAACAIEMVHTYSLIHDDLPAMDNDTLRRGRPTLHVVYGDAVAILAGDGLQAEAFALLAREPDVDDPEIARRKLRVSALVAGAAGSTGMVGGQTIDIQAAGQAAGRRMPLDADGLRAMHASKTGALITAAAESGAIMAGGAPGTIEAIRQYATDFGLAFQIVDDVLDVEGDAATLGKSAGKDAAGAKPSYPSLFGLDRSKAMAAECIDRARAALDSGGLNAGWLWPIAEWMLTRKS